MKILLKLSMPILGMIEYIAFLIHKRYIPDPEQLNQQRFKCAAQMREPLYIFIDDLDRCKHPKSAELMQAINLMIADDPSVVLIF